MTRDTLLGMTRDRFLAMTRDTLLALTRYRLTTVTRVVIQDLYEVDLRVQDCAFEVIGEEEVAAAADVQHRAGQFLELNVHKVCHRIIFHETARLHLHSEGVHLRQILIVFGLYHSTSSEPCQDSTNGKYPAHIRREGP